jgi:aminobenzoyl-glutamate utilization protein A
MEEIVKLRRELHKHPELGFAEFWTASKVVEMLQALNYEVLYGEDALDKDARMGVPSKEELDAAYQRAIDNGANPEVLKKMEGGLTAVIGVLKGKEPGPTISFRFDMDALPICESTDEGHFPVTNNFRSTFEGNMHACGHDGHTAIGLAFAREMKDGNFAGTLKLVFQPAEEEVKGAYSIVQKGIVDDVDKLYCFHLGTGLSLGEISGGSRGWLATTKLQVHFYGVPAHAGACPEKGKNALLGAATALLNMHALPRHSTEKTRINVGQLEGGTAVNVIPQYAKMLAETRSTSSVVNQELEEQVKKVVEHSAGMHGLRHKIEAMGFATSLDCDEELVNVVKEEAGHIKEFHKILGCAEAGGSEDASLLMNRVQERGGKATYMLIGTHVSAVAHNQGFDIDERVLAPAVRLLVRIAKRELAPKS